MGCSDFDPVHIIWALVLAGAAVLGAFGFRSSDWIHPKDNPSDVSCGPYIYCVGDDCHRYDTYHNDEWEAAMWLMVVGLFLVFVSVVGALVTVFCAQWQPLVHNVSCFGSVVALIGLICFAFGFSDTRASRTEQAPCNFCGEKTDTSQIENCELGKGMIMMIVAVVVLFIAGILGFTVYHRGSAPEVYRERSLTGRKRKSSHDEFRRPNQRPGPNTDNGDKWQKNTPEGASMTNSAF